MTLKSHGKNTSSVEVLNISSFGFWILVKEKEYFLPYKDFPWFQDQILRSIQNVELIHDHHLYWPDLDVDLDVNSFNNLEKFSLVSKHK
jgi:hypothetical protein